MTADVELSLVQQHTIKGNEIPLLARVLCVADSFDAMISNRPYRLSMGRDRAVSELKLCAENQFDPQVVQAFLARSREQKAHLSVTKASAFLSLYHLDHLLITR
jgi:HD-GYP domain-containing protein (c-di-GMP phosphodiesterase class II)